MFRSRLPLVLSLPFLLFACASTGPSVVDQSDESGSDGDGPTVYGKISVSVDAINSH
jgi:hypothetical protein